MNLGKIIAATSILLAPFSFSSQTYGQQLMAQKTDKPRIEISSEEIEGIPKPKGAPAITLDVKVQFKRYLGLTVKIGTVEIRKNSLYATFLFGHYQLLFEKLNDSTYVEHLFNKSIRKDDTARYEIFTTIKRENSMILADYKTISGNKRTEKEILENKIYDKECLPAIETLNKFLNDKLEQRVNVIVLGIEYNFNLYDKSKGKEVTKFAKMSEVIHEPDDRFLLEEYINLYGTRENGKIKPIKFEGQFTVVNSGGWDGIYKATGIVKK